MSLDWVYDWIVAALPGYDPANVFRSKQSVGIPIESTITYNVVYLDIGASDIPRDGKLYADPDYRGAPPTPIGTFDRTYQQNCPLQLQIDCYSPNGMTDLQSLISFAHSDTAKIIFNTAHCGLIGAGQIKDLAYLADNDYKDRWQVTVDFMIAMTRTEMMRAILEWEINGTIHIVEKEIGLTIEA